LNERSTHSIRALLYDLGVARTDTIHDQNQIRIREHIEMMRYKETSSARERSIKDTPVQQMVADMRIDGRERVIEKHDLAGFIVGSSSKTDTLSLTAGQGNSFLTDPRPALSAVNSKVSLTCLHQATCRCPGEDHTHR